MKKTKIVCTMGPNTNDRELMKQLALEGMDVARFNFSHGDHEEQKGRMELLKSIREEIGRPIAALLDTKGPEIRTGELKDDKKVQLVAGNTYVLTIDEVVGDDKKASVSYKGLINDVGTGNKILIDDGLIELEVMEIKGNDIICRINNGGEMGQKKGVNVPNVNIKLPSLTEKDKSDIIFGVQQGFDFVAASFVRNAACVNEIREIIEAHNGDMQIIAKIENAEGIENIDEIIGAADGIMVARGDMGVEIPPEQVPYVQKMIIKKCSERCKPVITATQMLDSMMRNPRPTRAEVTDVANAVYDGTDAVMLSGETANGKYPLEALKMMAQIVSTAESHITYDDYKNRKLVSLQKNVSNVVCHSTVSTAAEINAKAIIAPSWSGFTTKMISKWRPKNLVIGMSPNESKVRKMQLFWGVVPILSKKSSSTDELIKQSVELAKEHGYVKIDDIVVITAGIFDVNGKPSEHKTNMMRVVSID
jgi:pyruvate kinase